MDREFFGNIALIVAILMPMWIWGLLFMPMILEDDTPEYKLSEEAIQFRRTNQRLLNLGTWVSLILSTLVVVIVVFGI